jgi:hypothetical protein
VNATKKEIHISKELKGNVLLMFKGIEDTTLSQDIRSVNTFRRFFFSFLFLLFIKGKTYLIPVIRSNTSYITIH